MPLPSDACAKRWSRLERSEGNVRDDAGPFDDAVGRGQGAGGGRGAYSSADGGLPVALRLASPLANVPAKAVAYRPGAAETLVAGKVSHVYHGGGGRGIYAQVDGDLPVAAGLDIFYSRAQAVVQTPMPLSSNCEAPWSGDASPEAAVHVEKVRRDDQDFQDGSITGMFLNIQGLTSHLAELVAVIRLAKHPPSLVCLNETFLDKATEDIQLEGYKMVARRDRSDGRKGGGVAVYACENIAARVTLLKASESSERVWLILHADTGPYLLGVWYRPPVQGEVETVQTLQQEWEAHSKGALGTIIVGDMNVHHIRWLRFSSKSTPKTPEGEALKQFCEDHALRQIVKEPTRGDYLLDLLLTDLEQVKCKVVQKVADHKALWFSLPLPVPRSVTLSRLVWQFSHADWDGLKCLMAQQDWSWLSLVDVHTAARQLTDLILSLSRQFIPQRTMKEHKSTHPWVNAHVVQLVKEKRNSEGTECEAECRERCSAGILEEYGNYINKERTALQEIPRGVKEWWTKSIRLLQKKGTVSSIPALRQDDGKWLHNAKDKANLFASTLSRKFKMADAESNEYTMLDNILHRGQGPLKAFATKDAENILGALREDSGTGPDRLPSRILRVCAKELAEPVRLLATLILATGVWPDMWLEHWIVPLFKKSSTFDPRNYRGIHLTAQLSKVIERLLKTLCMPYITRTVSFGANQFAYTTGRGARDALAMLTLTWIRALAKGRKIGVYCSDVSGAFDRVKLERLVAKLHAKKLHPLIVAVLTSWLRQRVSRIVVGGDQSDEMELQDMVFQGTVLGPTLWNVFFEDARRAINEMFFTEVVFADDLNAYREFTARTSDEIIKNSTTKCQRELHSWGRANQVSFDPLKESHHILTLTDPTGSTFKLLGVIYDDGLVMDEAIAVVVSEASWKMRTLLRTKRFYTDADLIVLYKAHLLSYLEYRTPAIYHGTREVLARLDAVQTKFLRDVGIDEVTALMEFNLAPLRMRRDIAMLGVLHRAALGEGPPQLREMFRRRPGSYMMEDPYYGATRHPLVKRSAWGLLPVYNKLGSGAQSIATVKNFQFYLQERVKKLIRQALVGDDWPCSYSPR